jgi:Ankyrin repeats (3 copies)/Ankyrin repeat
MFPNPQDALPLPPHPNLEQYKKRAKDLLRASQSFDPAAIRAWAAAWIDSLVRLSDLTITPELPVRIDHWTDEVEKFARKELPQTTSEARPSETATLAAAQFVIARAHGFESWPKMAKHVESIALANSPIDNFEQCVDAIVGGDVATLERLLREHPDLIRAHSTRRHQATLLHYVSANGVEGYRQKTPKNIVQIAKLLLDCGADVNAVADVYGGSTTLALVATSVHPERAGVQEPLMQLLLDFGATIDAADATGSLVATCLANGRVKAAEFLAQRGATLDLEAAAGIGRLEEVKRILDNDPQRNLAGQQIECALLWACEYGRNDVVEFLLQRGVSVQARANTGQTALHWAVIGGHIDTIRLLLTRGARLETPNSYGGTALGQALWSALNGDAGIDYVGVIELLLKSGAKVEEGTLPWLARQKPESSTKKRITELLHNRA